MTNDPIKLADLERVSHFNKDFILEIAQDVAWLRETTCRRTPPALPDVKRGETDVEAIHYADIVTATLVALRDKGLIPPYVPDGGNMVEENEFAPVATDFI